MTMVYEVVLVQTRPASQIHTKKCILIISKLGLDSTRAFKLSLESAIPPSQDTRSPSSAGRSLLKAAQAEQLPASKQVDFKAPAPEQGSLFLPPFSCCKETKVAAMLL